MSVDGNPILLVTQTKNSTKSSLILLTPHTQSFNRFYWLYLQNTSRLWWLLTTSPAATLVQTTTFPFASRPQATARGIQTEDQVTLLLKTHFTQSKMARKVQHWEFSHLKVTVLTTSSAEISSPDNCMAQPSMPSLKLGPPIEVFPDPRNCLMTILLLHFTFLHKTCHHLTYYIFYIRLFDHFLMCMLSRSVMSNSLQPHGL